MVAKANPLPSGTEAPEFNYRDASGIEQSTAELRGRAHVVYFYPRDNTPGCTKEACGFRDAYASYADAGVTVIGVSPDSDASHGKFRQKHELPFGLAADTDQSIAKAYGVWGLKKFMGREFEGVHRTTFIVGPDGLIKKVFPKVSPATHASEVLDALTKL